MHEASTAMVARVAAFYPTVRHAHLDALLALPPREAARALEILAAEQRWRDVPNLPPLERAGAASATTSGWSRAMLSLAREITAHGGRGTTSRAKHHGARCVPAS